MTDTARLARRAWGDPHGAAPLVLLHGFGGCAAQWEQVATRLSGDGVPVIAFDLPGHGASIGHPGPRHARAMADALVPELARLRGPVHLTGHSLGGAVAALAALAAPAGVASLTFLAPGGFGPEINGAALQAYAAASGVDAMEAALRRFHLDGAATAPDVAAAMAGRRAAPGQAEALAALASVIIRPDGTQGVLPLERVAALGLPLTVIWGERDAIVPAGQAGALSGARRVLLPGLGHMIADEAPDAIAALLAQAAQPR